MTTESFDQFLNNQSKSSAAEIQDEDKDSTYSKVKNFTSAVETIEKKELVEDKKRKVHYQNSLLGIIVCFNQ